MAVQPSSYDGIKPFFGSDDRAPTVLNYLYPDGNFSTCRYNTAAALKGSWLDHTMTVDCYEDKKFRDAKGEAASDDYHYEFIDFIILTALFHRAIDRSTGLSQNIKTLVDAGIKDLESKRNVVTQGIDNKVVGTADADTGEMFVAKVVKYVHANKTTYGTLSAMEETTSDRATALVRPILRALETEFKKVTEFSGLDLNADAKEQKIMDDAIARAFVDTAAEYKVITIPTSFAIHAMFRLKLKIHLPLAMQKIDIFRTRLADIKRLDSNEARDLATAIYTNWKSWPKNVHDFYSAHLMVMSDRAGNGWEQLPNVDLETLIPTISGQETNYRLNIRKDFPGSVHTMFESTLPGVEINRSMWWSDRKSTPPEKKRIEIKNENALRELYRTAYEEGKVGSVTGLNTTHFPPNTGGFNLNWQRHFASSMRDDVKRNAATTPVQPASTSTFIQRMSPPLLDMATGNLWWYSPADEKLYKGDGTPHNWLPYDEKDDNTSTNCYGTYLASKNKPGKKEQCNELLLCIGGDALELSADCLKLLENQDLMDIAQQDMKSVPPTMIRTVLRKLGVQAIQKPRPDGTLEKVMMTVEQWYSYLIDPTTPIDPAVKAAILKNDKLREYVGYLLLILNGNPTILNKNASPVTNGPLQPQQPTYASHKGLEYGVYPQQDSASSYRLLADVLNNQVQYEDAVAQYNPTVHDLMVNLQVGQYGGNIGGQFGGNHDPETVLSSKYDATYANKHTEILNSLLQGLYDSGAELDVNEQDEIKGLIKMMGENEEKLAKIFYLLKLVIEYARSVGLYEVSRQKTRKPFKLDNVKTKADLEKFLGTMIDMLQDKLNTGKSLHMSMNNDTNRTLAKIALLVANMKAPNPQAAKPTYVPLSD